ncbi:hypothetical protein HO173_006276 [Letharia columbiana]|uniref:AB hydrolase-1 domain-containing protein n=1 Tax=Letharia columbiana TaxID=112416 RepID=A0A8H6L4R8_9LECA|nr:uncharacterized protein HO173_006276 [Letharia columbiana]KAF6235593.1 hypothetical protein HO173_006276 [Letharia columbiana]
MYPFFKYSPANHYFDYGWYNFELLRLLGSAPHGGCDVAEFLEAVTQLRPNDALSWQRTFLHQAEKVELLALDARAHGHAAAARNAFLRASNYFRAAQYLHPAAPAAERPHLLAVYERSTACFEAATRLFPHRPRQVAIPYETEQGRRVGLPGWLYLPAPSQRLPDRQTPVLVCVGGADSTQEELYFLSVAEGPALGYAVLTFDGPGQGLVLRRDGLPMRPDWESVCGPVLDFLRAYAAGHPDIGLDVDAVVLTGQSLGGYLALRGAADPRVKACVAVDSFYDMWDLANARMPGWMVRPWLGGWMGDWFIDWAVCRHGRADVATRYQFALAQGMFGCASPCDTLREMMRYTFKLRSRKGEDEAGKDYLARISCPVLISGAAADPKSFLPELSTDLLYDNLVNVRKEDKEVWIAKAWSDGGLQAKCGAWSLLQYRTFRFLDEKLSIVRAAADEGSTVSDT